MTMEVEQDLPSLRMRSALYNPDSNMHWVEAHYAQGRKGYVFIPGHWSRDPAAEMNAEAHRNSETSEADVDPWQIEDQLTRLELARKRLHEEHEL